MTPAAQLAIDAQIGKVVSGEVLAYEFGDDIHGTEELSYLIGQAECRGLVAERLWASWRVRKNAKKP